MTLIRIIYIFALVTSLCISNAVTAQSSPLPQELEVQAYPTLGPHAAVLNLDLTTQQTSSPGGKIVGRIAIDSRPAVKRVYFLWQFGTQTTQSEEMVAFESTSFQPTAVCVRSFTDDRVYVAGWNARLGSVIVEEWVFSGAQVLGPPLTPEWEPEDRIGVVPSFSAPSIQRNLLFSCDSLEPILDIVLDRHGDTLLLLEMTGVSARTIYSYPLGSSDSRCASLQVASAGAPSALLDSTNFPPLAGKSSLWADQHASSGYIVYASARATWQRATANSLSEVLVIMRDANNDGIYEELNTSSYSSFFAIHDLWDTETVQESVN